MTSYKVENEYKKSGKRNMHKRTKWASIYLIFNKPDKLVKMLRCKRYKVDWIRVIVEGIEDFKWRYDKPGYFYTIDYFYTIERYNLEYNTDLQKLENMYNLIKKYANKTTLQQLPILPEYRS